MPRDRGPSLSGWGRHPVVRGSERRDERLERVARAGHGHRLARGLGRAYGDAALPAPGDEFVCGTTRADRILALDPATTTLVAESGASLDALFPILLARGLVVPVTPGTRYVTLGGMVACDVHGKNHHRAGCIGEHVSWLRVLTASGDVVRCSRDEHADLFRATIGGMGLTGTILEVALRLERVPTPWIVAERVQAPDIDRFLELLEASAATWPMTVGWIDCLARGARLGRGVLSRGRWALPDEAPAGSETPQPPRRWTMPFDLPSFALGRAAVAAFNEAYFRRSAHAPRLVHPYAFLHPLDGIDEWRRMYGRRGFAQYQCVLPRAAGGDAVRRVLELLARTGGASFLAVIKDCGTEGLGLLSFPRAGTSLALDLPMRDGTQALVDALNREVISLGGRIYLAKDALTRPADFRAMEPRLAGFLEVRRAWDPDGLIRSAQSVRLMGW